MSLDDRLAFFKEQIDAKASDPASKGPEKKAAPAKGAKGGEKGGKKEKKGGEAKEAQGEASPKKEKAKKDGGKKDGGKKDGGKKEEAAPDPAAEATARLPGIEAQRLFPVKMKDDAMQLAYQY